MGDRIMREIEIGNNLGMQTMWYKKGKFVDELPVVKTQEPNYIIQELNEVLNFI